MAAVTARLTRFGTPALVGAALAMVLALTVSGFTNTLFAGLSGGAATGAPISIDSPQPGMDFSSTSKDAISSGGVVAPGIGGVAGDRVDLVRYGNIALEVPDAAKSLKEIVAAVTAAGGYISSSSQYGDPEVPFTSATFRIPATSFDAVMATLHSSGKLLSEDTGSYEVTMQLVDLEARLKNLRASEAAYLSLMKRAVSVSDIVAVQAELSIVQGDIESFDAQRAALADQVAMANVSVTLSEPASPISDASSNFDLGRELSNALANLINVGRAVIVAVINIVVVAIPIAVLGGLFGSLLARGAAPLIAWFKKMVGGSRKGARRAARR